MKRNVLTQCVYAITLASGVLLANYASAQTAPASAASTNTPKIDQVQSQQAAKIQQGANSGALTPKEQAKLTVQQQKIANHEAAAKADGKVTKSERKHLKHEQKHAAANIAKKKHNAQHQ